MSEFSSAYSSAFNVSSTPSTTRAFLNCIEVDWSCDPDFADALDPAVRERAEAFASMALRTLTGYQVGNCPITVRPCVTRCTDVLAWMTAGSAGVPWHPYMRNGQWYNSCGCGPHDCACQELTEVVLDGPVAAIMQVALDGVVLDPTTYRVDNGNRLVRLSGPEWPTCQNMAVSVDAVGAFAVTYVRGVAVDAMTSFVAGILAKEYAEACMGNDCRLPASVTSIVRQGVSMEFDSRFVFPEGRTGIDEVDVWVKHWNPYGVKSPTRVFSPSISTPRQTTWST